MPKYKIGDQFKYHGGVREIIGVHEGRGVVNYWVSFNESVRLDTFPEQYIDANYAKTEPFFEVDKQYRHKCGSWTFTVIAIHGEGRKRVAVVEAEDYMDLLDATDFLEVIEID